MKQETKVCPKCGRELPFDYYHFPKDKNYESGYRNICRECDKKYGRFLNKDSKVHEKWSKQEDDLLKKIYKDYTNDEIVQFFPNRTSRAIECHAGTIGCQGKNEETLERAKQEGYKKSSIAMTGRIISDEVKAKISTTKQEYFKTHDGWWKGKKRPEEQCKVISDRMKAKGQWKGDNNPRHKNPLCGSENGRWQGGITPLYLELRSDTKDWQHDSMEFCNYKCVITNGEFDNVHHTTAFRQIVDEVFRSIELDARNAVENYSDDEISIIRCKLKYIHASYGYGACLCKQVHKLFHDTYGYIKASPESFLDFVYRIDCGEFDQWFEENNLKININYNYVNYLEQVLFALKSA